MLKRRKNMNPISIEQAIEQGVISESLVKDLLTKLTEQDILMYLAIKYYGYHVYELCEMFPNLNKLSIIHSYGKAYILFRTDEMFGFSNNALGWADSTRFRN